MAFDLRSQLENIFGKQPQDAARGEAITPPAIARPEFGATAPVYFSGTITEAFARYVTEYAGRDIEDPRGICVSFLADNFPKLIKLQYLPPHRNAAWQRARAKAVIPALIAGTFNEQRHRSEEEIRLKTLFWIEDVICRPDGIHPNCAKLVEGEEVYFKRYNKGVSDMKLVFTTIRQGGLRVVVTSFLCEAKAVHKYCGNPGLWPKNEGHPSGWSRLPIAPGPGEGSEFPPSNVKHRCLVLCTGCYISGRFGRCQGLYTSCI